ncbi:MAG: hypothetical protein N2316_13285, partial [Spirochaetes bacterium]|nr:hypothetical protein [Spirochaetota bacterium]
AGDCDTKSLLMALLLLECGYDAIVLDSYRYHHAMAALSVPGVDGISIEYRGKQYYVIESTYPNWAIGQMPPHYSDLSYFIPIDPREGRQHVEQAYAQVSSPSFQSAQGPSEREPNNTRDNADKVINTTISGELDESDSEDWYRLNGQEGTFAAITLISDGNSRFNIEIFSDESLVASSRSISHATTVTASLPGVCHIRISRLSGKGKYTIIISPGGPCEKEPNNDEENATQSLEEAILGELENPNDIDWYFLGGQEGFNSTYTIYHEQNANFDLAVINDGRQIGLASGTESGDFITCENPGKVQLKVFSKRGKGWYLIKIERNR